jgi:hypothetical protein
MAAYPRIRRQSPVCKKMGKRRERAEALWKKSEEMVGEKF